MHYSVLCKGVVWDAMEEFGQENTEIRKIDEDSLERLKKDYEEVVKVKDGKECFSAYVTENGNYVRKEPVGYELKPRKELYKSFIDFAYEWEDWTWDAKDNTFFIEEPVWGYYDWYAEGGRWCGTLYHVKTPRHPEQIRRFRGDTDTYLHFIDVGKSEEVPVYADDCACDCCCICDVDWERTLKGDYHTAFVSSGQWDGIENMTYEQRLKKAHEFFGVEAEGSDDSLVTVVDCHI